MTLFQPLEAEERVRKENRTVQSKRKMMGEN
jgi:hypothetical protein